MPELQDGKLYNPYKKFHNAWVPTQELRAIKISNGAKLLYGVLRRYAGKDGECFPGQKKLAKELACSVRTVQRFVAELRDGAHMIETRFDAYRGRLRYEFKAPELWKKDPPPVQMFFTDATEVSVPVPTELSHPSLEVGSEQIGSPNRNSSSRACGNVENFDSAPESAAIEGNQTEVGTSEELAEVVRQGENEDVLGGKLARNGWKVVRLGNQTPKDTDVTEGLRIRNSIRELAWSKRMDKRR